MSTRARTSFARRAEFYDRIVADAKLSRAAIAVAWRLINHMNDETGECFPSEERLAKQLNVTVRTVRRGVQQLIDAGWFTKKLRGRAGTNYFANYENRTPLSGKDDPENRTPVSLKPDNPGKKNRTTLSGEPIGEPNSKPKAPPVVPPDGVAEELEEAVLAFNALAERIGLPKVQNFSDTRRRKLQRRLVECAGLEGWRAALAKVEGSGFLTGDNRNGWRADFDFMIQAKSFTKILEGAYDDNPRRGRASSEVQAAFDRLDAKERGKR